MKFRSKVFGQSSTPVVSPNSPGHWCSSIGCTSEFLCHGRPLTEAAFKTCWLRLKKVGMNVGEGSELQVVLTILLHKEEILLDTVIC